MGNKSLTRRVGLLLVAATALAALALSASLVTTKANALPTFTTPVNGIGPCQSCHTKDQVHGVAAHQSFITGGLCANCHVNGDTSVPPTPVQCAACHGGVSVILKSASHTTQGCGTTAGCHGVPSGEVAPQIAIKTAASVKVKTSITISGTIAPASLAGNSVSITIQKKSGAKWKTVKTAAATISATGAYAYKYKPTTTGSYHVQGAMAAKAGVNKAAATAWKTFKVK
jgi:hypothetical protein